MYSMVLLAALTTTVDAPDFGRRGGGGCCGCYGGYGRGYGGCYGGGYGGGYGGCYGGGYGGCYGGGYGRGYGGYAGGWGGGYGGGYAYAPNWGGSYMPTYASLPMTTGTPYAALNTTQPYQSFYAGAGGQADMGNRAHVIVHVPANARVTVDGESTQSAGETRTFVSPPLQPDQTYHYTVKATMNNADGEPITRTQKVQVWAGKTSEATFAFNRSDNDRSERLNNPPSNDEDNTRNRKEKRTNDREPDKK